MEGKAVSITDLIQRVCKALDGGVGQVWVKGEITSIKAHGSGHWYFSLSDKQSTIRCVMWKTYNVRVPMQPPEGTEVFALASPTVFKNRGDLNFEVVALLPTSGVGAAQLAKERVRAALQADGLFDPARKRRFPAYPRRVAIVTSADGAALHDIINVARRRWRATRLYLVSAQVQGIDAPLSLARALGLVNRLTRVDLCVLARGGGSREDLSVFDDERVCRAVAALAMPCISAVGHQTDVSLADLVADAFAPTPSAAMERVLPDLEETVRHAESLAARLAHGLRRRTSLVSARLTRHQDRILAGMEHRLREPAARLDRYAAQLEALSPLKVLGRGYAIARLPDGRVVKQRADLPPGTGFTLRVSDGEVPARSS